MNELILDDLEQPCPACPDTPGQLHEGGKWLGPCTECGGLARIPSASGAVLLQFIKRHTRRLAEMDM